MMVDEHGNYIPEVPFRNPGLAPWPPQPTSARTVTHYHVGSIHEQMGVDPMSKLAAAIERLCDILEK